MPAAYRQRPARRRFSPAITVWVALFVVDRQHVAGRFAADARDGFLIAAMMANMLPGLRSAARYSRATVIILKPSSRSAGCGGERRVLAKRSGLRQLPARTVRTAE